jgi:hypothetical protein
VLRAIAPCFAVVTPRCLSNASLNCVCCYWSEALIAEGNVAKACEIMQEAVQRLTAVAAADADVNVTLACTLAVAGFPSLRTIYSLYSPLRTIYFPIPDTAAVQGFTLAPKRFLERARWRDSWAAQRCAAPILR